MNTEFLSRNYFFIATPFNYNLFPLLCILNILLLSIPSFLTGFYLKKESEGTEKQKLTFSYFINNYYKSLIICAVINVIFFMYGPFKVILLIIALPITALWHFIALKEQKNVFSSLGRTFSLTGNALGKVLGLYFMISFISIVVFFFIDSPLIFSYFEILNWNLSLGPETTQKLLVLLVTFTSVFALQIVIPIIAAGNGLLYFSLKEIKEAGNLKEGIKNWGKKTK